jgi:poly(A) polymerase
MIQSYLRGWIEPNDVRGRSIYLVGGTVRDLLLGLAPKDLDLVCRNAKDLGSCIARRRNAALVPMEKIPDEPCYRVVDRADPERYLDIAEMRGETIYDDLARRDFTINAIALELKEDGTTGDFIDPFHGKEDMDRKVIRMVNDLSLLSDPLRVLRGLRLASALGFAVEEATLKEMEARAGLLRDVSSERIMTELLLILKSPRSAISFREMDLLGGLEAIFPEIVPMKECEQNGYHHKDVWGHSLLVMEHTEHILNRLAEYFGDHAAKVAENLGEERRSLLKLTALLHDVGKPLTRGMKTETGRITFHGHDKEGSIVAERIADRLKMSNRQRTFITRIIAEHLKPLSHASPRARTAARLRWFRRMRDDSVPAVILSMADVMSSLGPESGEEYRMDFISRAVELVTSYFESVKPRIEAPLLINGGDLISMGMKPGIALGNLLYKIRFAQDMGKITTREEALQAARELVRKVIEAGKQTE